jgi:hypothetical protein
MSTIKNFPFPLKRKLFLTIIIGFLCFAIGLVMYFMSKDIMMLFLSSLVFCMSFVKAFFLYRIIAEHKYETVEGTCVSITPKPLRKYRKIKIMDDFGTESSILLGKQTKLKIGFRYRLYFKQMPQQYTSGSEYFDSALSSDGFLGFEELGEFDSPDAE